MNTTLHTAQDTVWENRAMQCINGLLPASIDRKELEKAIWELEDCGPEKLSSKSSNLINQVLAYQSGSEDHQSLPTEDEAESAQDAPEDVQLGEDAGEIENAPQSQPEAAEGKSEVTEQPPTHRRDLAGIGLPTPHKEELKQAVDSIKSKIKLKKSMARELGKNLKQTLAREENIL